MLGSTLCAGGLFLQALLLLNYAHTSYTQLMNNLPAGPVHPGFQEMPVYGPGPEAELRKHFDQRVYRGGPLPPDHHGGFAGHVRPHFWTHLTEEDQEMSFSDRVQNGFRKLGKNCVFNFVGEILDRALCVELKWTWFCTIFGALCVVLCGVFPAIFLPIETGNALHQPAGIKKLKRLLSFSVGSLLGDVFLHILPETWNSANYSSLNIGLWIIFGLLLCFLVEKMCSKSEESQHRVTAVMNLIANLIDNFTHGLAVGASFLVNIKFGILTTFAILIHEIPHEIGDFAILLRADFNRWQAVKAQLVTAFGGVLGATVALMANEDAALDQRSAWILPFTAGGFLNIALVEILPDLIKETNGRESLKQIFLLLMGVGVMGVLNLVHCLEY